MPHKTRVGPTYVGVGLEPKTRTLHTWRATSPARNQAPSWRPDKTTVDKVNQQMISLAIRRLEWSSRQLIVWVVEQMRPWLGLAAAAAVFTVVLYFWQASLSTFTRATKGLVNIQFILCLSMPTDTDEQAATLVPLKLAC